MTSGCTLLTLAIFSSRISIAISVCEHVVNARAAAAQVGHRHLRKLRARVPARATAAARCVIFCPCARWQESWYVTRALTGPMRGIERDGGQKLVHIASSCATKCARLCAYAGSCSSSSSYSFSVEPQPAALLMIASNLPLQNRVDVLPRQLARWIAHSGMDVQRAATGLPGGNHHFAAVLAQHAHGRFIQARER